MRYAGVMSERSGCKSKPLATPEMSLLRHFLKGVHRGYRTQPYSVVKEYVLSVERLGYCNDFQHLILKNVVEK